MGSKLEKAHNEEMDGYFTCFYTYDRPSDEPFRWKAKDYSTCPNCNAKIIKKSFLFKLVNRKKIKDSKLLW